MSYTETWSGKINRRLINKLRVINVAAGRENGGYADMDEAIEAMKCPISKVYQPIPENVDIYQKLFAEYRILHDYFARGENDVMKRLKKIRNS